MGYEAHLKELRDGLDNALSLLEGALSAPPAKLAPAVRQARALVEGLRGSLDRLDEHEEVLTDPALDAAHEVVTLRRELERERQRARALQERLATATSELEIAERLGEEDRAKVQALERSVADFDKRLMTDDAAYGRYMEDALREEERRRKKR